MIIVRIKHLIIKILLGVSILLFTLIIYYTFSKFIEYDNYFEKVAKLEIGDSFTKLKEKGNSLGFVYITTKSRDYNTYIIKLSSMTNKRIYIDIKENDIIEFININY
jgi:hypothetical protein